MKTTTFGAIALVSLFALGGCEKDSGLPSKTSGKLRAHENALLANLPGDNIALFGGNYMRLQDFFLSGPMAKMMEGQMDAQAPGMAAWTRCFIERDVTKLQIMGGVQYKEDVAAMTFVMKGLTIQQIDACAKKASFPSTIDPDGTFVAVELPHPAGAYTSGYLALADGMLFSRQALPFPEVDAAPRNQTRADFEAAAATAKTKSAAADTVLVEEAARVDRDRAVWFVANLNGTPAADKIGMMRGWIDVDKGIDLDVSVQITDRETAEEISRGIPEIKKQASMLGKEVGAVVRGLRYERKGDRFRFGIKISNQQIEAIMSSMGGMLGGGF